MSASSDAPSSAQLIEAAEGFKKWVTGVAPGARVVICGGAAVAFWGGGRATKDLDTALDFSKCVTKINTNTLKDRARNSKQFDVGLEIFYKLDSTTSVQVDFVDASLFFHPWDPSMYTIYPEDPEIQVLTIPTLLVQKMVTVLDRSYPDATKLHTKRVSDFDDFRFLLRLCTRDKLQLLDLHKVTFGSDHSSTIQKFAALAREMSALNDDDFAMWNGLVTKSGFGDDWKINKKT